MKIIVVEDEIRICEGICRLIEKIGDNYEVAATADNGEDGLKLILENSPDIVITDIMMPGMSGLEMLAELKKKDRMPKVIVISAYSEFSYAQEAMRLGVREYLTKPITIGELTQTLSNLANEISDDNDVPETLSSLNNIFLGIINGIIDVDEKLVQYMDNRHGIRRDTVFVELTAYLGYYYEENVESVKKTIGKILDHIDGTEYIILELPKEMSLLALIYKCGNLDEMERHIKTSIQRNPLSMRKVCTGMIRAEGLENIQSSYRIINSYLHWNMIFGDGVIITFPQVTEIKVKKCEYPVETENLMKTSLYSMDKAATLNSVKKFEDYFFDGSLYNPQVIKEAYTRFIWAALGILKEINEFEQIAARQKQLIERINEAKSSGEMRGILDMVFGSLFENRKEDENLGLTVKRTINMIHEFYKDGITLDEIAGKLGITPEYLSAQFQKEMGLNFSSYIRNYRIGKAKLMLVGSNMKVYEIAAEVGYSDPKYFSRVFRQVTGQKPDEYRKTQK